MLQELTIFALVVILFLGILSVWHNYLSPWRHLNKELLDNIQKLKDKDQPHEEWDEERMNIIGQNGNDGLHYEDDNCYTPDNWVIMEIFRTNKPSFYKVLAGWSGGYIDGDRWRMNSGIKYYTQDPEYYYFHGESGSVYKCRKIMETEKLNNAHIVKHLTDSGLARRVHFKDIKVNLKYE